VGDPSNFPRLLALYKQDEGVLRSKVKGYHYDDESTKSVMSKVKEDWDYTMDPHGAVAYLGLKEYLKDKSGYTGVFLETAHPGKFREVVEECLGEKVILPDRLAAFLKGEKEVINCPNNYQDFRRLLLSEILHDKSKAK
jgi:threonine synthase